MRKLATLALGTAIGIGATLGYQQCTAPNPAQYAAREGSLDAVLNEPAPGVPWYVTERVEKNERALYLVQNGVNGKSWMLPNTLPTLLEAREGYGGSLIDGVASSVTDTRHLGKSMYQTVKGWFTKATPTPLPTRSGE